MLTDVTNNKNNTPLTKPYKEIFSLYGLKQLIESPTRITVTTSTLIDHILTNSHEKVSQSGVIDVSLSDHQIIFCTRKIYKQKYHKHNKIKIRSLKNYSQQTLLEKLKVAKFPI